MSYRKNRDQYILSIQNRVKSISKVIKELWGDGGHPFFKDSTARRYIIMACKRASSANMRGLSLNLDRKKVWWNF